MYFDQVILTRLLFFTILSSRSSVVCFFFESYADHRDLHSFPTRRSSDLRMLPRRAASEVRASEEDRRALCLRLVELELRMRSEEHTSELQSLRHLVCRLLLEKKKTISSIRPKCTTTWAIRSTRFSSIFIF